MFRDLEALSNPKIDKTAITLSIWKNNREKITRIVYLIEFLSDCRAIRKSLAESAVIYEMPNQ